MDRFDLRPATQHGVSFALVVLCAVSGIALLEVVRYFSGQFVTAILVLPVIIAAWFGGLVVGTLTIALQAVLAVLVLPPVGRFAVDSPDELIRLSILVAASAFAILLVTAVRNVERRFRAVVTVADDGIWTVDADGRTTYVNPRMAEMLGFTPADMRGRRFSEFVRPDDASSTEAAFERQKHGMHERAECALVRKDGSSVWVHYAATPLSDGSRFIGALAVVSDLSELKRNETTIRQQATALKQANRQKEDFLAMLGHELRNAVGPLMTAVKLMEIKSDGTLRRERAVILRQAEHLSRLVDDISDVSRFMRGKLHIRCETVNVSQLVHEACEFVSPLVSRSHHALDVDVSDGLILQGDTIRLRQVLVNLLTNAAKYTPSGGRVHLTAASDGGDHVLIRVHDTGVGIAPDFLPVLFEPFTQKSETLDRAEGGLGLGLAIVRGIVHAHGGTIEARSDGVGHGSEFIVRLPVVVPMLSVAVEDVAHAGTSSNIERT